MGASRQAAVGLGERGNPVRTAPSAQGPPRHHYRRVGLSRDCPAGWAQDVWELAGYLAR
jgi:hypothetical protein